MLATPSPLLLILLSVLCTSVAQVALKLAVPVIRASDPFLMTVLRLSTHPWLIVGICLYLLALGLWIAGLKELPVSYAYPFVALGVVLVTLFSWIFLSESIHAGRIAGMSLIVAGLLIVSRT
jgi:drug/metabolite transporter (DMT)-like permease